MTTHLTDYTTANDSTEEGLKRRGELEATDSAAAFDVISEEVSPDSKGEESVDSRDADDGLSLEERVPLLQALLISHGDPLAMEQLVEVTRLEPDTIYASLGELRTILAGPTSGIELVEVGARFQIRTKVAYSPFIRALKAERPRKLSSPALETLAIVAYQQPVAKSDIDKLRGVDSTPTLKTLLERGLVRVVGQASSVGHPSLYGTTEDFLKIFGLSALTDLPSLREAGFVERDPGEPGELIDVTTLDDEELAHETASDSLTHSHEETLAMTEPKNPRALDSNNGSTADSAYQQGARSATSNSPQDETEPSSINVPITLAGRIDIERIPPEEEARIMEDHESNWFEGEEPAESAAMQTGEERRK
jgi:segregation and condensation protein B